MIGKFVIHYFDIINFNIFRSQNIINRKDLHRRIIIRPVGSQPLIITAVSHIEIIQQAGKLISILIGIKIAHNHFILNRIIRDLFRKLRHLNLAKFPSGHLLRSLRAQMDIVKRNLFSIFFNDDALSHLRRFQFIGFQRTCR